MLRKKSAGNEIYEKPTMTCPIVSHASLELSASLELIIATNSQG